MRMKMASNTKLPAFFLLSVDKRTMMKEPYWEVEEEFYAS